MAAETPSKWARSKLYKLDQMGEQWLRWTKIARDVSLPGVPVAALAGFCFNGDPYNTTGWRVGDEAERQEAIRKGRFPFKDRDPQDTKEYGHIGSHDLHEAAWWGTESGHCPTPVATDPDCAWVRLSDDEEVVKVLGRKAVTGAAWYGAIPDQCAIGVANIRRHWRNARSDLHPSLQWREDDKLATAWRLFVALAHWSAGGRACSHINAYHQEIASAPEAERIAVFCRLAAKTDDPGGRHRQDEYTAWKTACKFEGGVHAASKLDEPWAVAWIRQDGFRNDAEREDVYAKLASIAGK